MKNSFINIIALLSLCFFQASCHNDSKIAFLFLARGPMPLEEIWHEFFHWRANPAHYSIYIHPHSGYKYPATSFFHGKAIDDNIKHVQWGGMSQVLAIKHLVEAALLDPLNERFCLMSESCIPLVPFEKWRNVMLSHNKSIVNACPMPGMEGPTRWRKSLDSTGLKMSHWRKSATWFALNREHAQVFVNEKATETAWESVPCCDEHYLPTILAYNGLDNETTCSDGFTYVHWPNNMASHPTTFDGSHITREFIVSLERPFRVAKGEPQFSMTCSGFAEICHFTARKFAASTKYPLFENMDLILGDEEHPYTGNPWDRNANKLRKSKDGQSFYMIDGGVIRLIPDNITLAYLHFDANVTAAASTISAEDEVLYSKGDPMPSMKDGKLIKAHKNREVWYLQGGRRHSIPNQATFYAMNLDFGNVETFSQSDVDQILIGNPLPNIESKPQT